MIFFLINHAGFNISSYIFMCVHFYWLIRFNGHKPTTKKNFKYVIFYFFKTQGKNNHAPLPTMTKTS
jgi:hypothetical protein